MFAVNLMYSFGGSVGNYQYLIQDLLYTTVLASLMGFTRPARALSRHRPPERLMSLGIWLPVAAQFVTAAGFQLLALGTLLRQPWYVRFDPHTADGATCFTNSTANSARCSESYENSAVFLVSLGQFLITAVVFNKGPPHRRPLYTNVPLLLGAPGWCLACACPALLLPWPCAHAALLSQTGFLLFLILAPGGGAVTHSFAGLVPFPSEFRLRLCAVLVLNLAAAWLIDWGASAAYRALRGRRVLGKTVL